MAWRAEQGDGAGAEISEHRDAGGRRILQLTGRLDADGVAPIWRRALELAAGGAAGVVDGSRVDYCDGAGAALLVALCESAGASGSPGALVLEGFSDDTQRLVDRIAGGRHGARSDAPADHSWVAALGRSGVQLAADVSALVVYVGELALMLGAALARPSRLRPREVAAVAERAGIGAVPIIALVGFLLGLILAFQSVIPMQRFGAEIFVADLLGIAMLRELGPLMAAILLVARSGSAFAAELGTMRVNEELDALTTMGLEPVRFLVVPRVIAVVLVVPVLAMVMNLAGLAGGALVFLSMDYPLTTYVSRVVDAASAGDLLGGLAKSFVLGLIVAAIGCYRGLATGSGAGAVGDATTRAVVSGIVLIAIAEGSFAVIFYVMGW